LPCGWSPECAGASASPCASSRSPPWGWSPAWSRPGKRARFLRHLQDILKPGVLLYDLLCGAFLGRDGVRPPPAEAQAVQRAAECLPAHKRGGPLPEELEGDELATPARAQPAMLGGGILLEQLLDALTRLLPEQRPRTAPSVVVE